MADTLKNATRIGGYALKDLLSRVHSSKPFQAAAYASGLDPDSNIPRDIVRTISRAGSSAMNWVNSESPRIPVPPPYKVSPALNIPNLAPATMGDYGNDYASRTSAEIVAPQITQRETSFMDRRGAFTGPNNDPTTPGMNREAPRETELPTFYEDDARYKKGQAAIAERESRANVELRKAMAGGETAEVTDRQVGRKVSEEQRRRNNQIQDSEEAFKADQRRMQLENLQEEMRRRAQWSADRGGMPWSAEAQAEDYRRELDRGIALEGESKIRAVNSDEIRYIAGLDGISQGIIPEDPDLRAKIEEITGVSIDQVSIAPRDIEILKTQIRSEAERERSLARDTWMTLLKAMKTNVSEKSSELGG